MVTWLVPILRLCVRIIGVWWTDLTGIYMLYASVLCYRFYIGIPKSCYNIAAMTNIIFSLSLNFWSTCGVHVLSLLFLHYLLLHLWGFFFLLWSLCWLEGDSCIALKLVLIVIYDAYSTYYWKNQTENLSNLFHCMEAVVVEKP